MEMPFWALRMSVLIGVQVKGVRLGGLTPHRSPLDWFAAIRQKRPSCAIVLPIQGVNLAKNSRREPSWGGRLEWPWGSEGLC